MTIMDMINQGNVLALLFMGAIIAGILAMYFFFNNALKKNDEEKKNDPSVGSSFRRSGNSTVTAPVTAAISAAVNEYRKK
ncbi:MAG: hypothetical protein FWF68_02885 [Spirochaetes bacterium]|nr:hypothetical protein [Spirochaetota bacterium]